MKGLWARLSLQVFDSSLEIGEQKMLSYRLNMPLKKSLGTAAVRNYQPNTSAFGIIVLPTMSLSESGR